MCTVLVAFLRSIAFSGFSLLAAKRLHNRMLQSVLESRMRFFDLNPVGRIMNRFSKDIGNIDDVLPVAVFDCTQVCLFEDALPIIHNKSLFVAFVIYPSVRDESAWCHSFGCIRQLCNNNTTCARWYFTCLHPPLLYEIIERDPKDRGYK